MAISPYNPEMKLSTKYTLRDLTITNQPYPNMPTTQSELDNLKWLARTLEEMERDVGPFKIISAFRSQEVQNAVKGVTLTTRAGIDRPKSFHEAGMAVDLWPTNMSIEQYFAKILAIPKWRDGLGEIALKPTQNAVHLSMPTEKYRGVASIMDEAGKYVKLSLDEIEDWASKFAGKVSSAIASSSETLTQWFNQSGKSVEAVWGELGEEYESKRLWLWIGGGALVVGIAAMLYYRKK